MLSSVQRGQPVPRSEVSGGGGVGRMQGSPQLNRATRWHSLAVRERDGPSKVVDAIAAVQVASGGHVVLTGTATCRSLGTISR